MHNRRPCIIAGILSIYSLFGSEVATVPGKVLWQEPADLQTRNLLFGPGGEAHVPPAGPFEFVKEDMNGTNPKFTVKDSSGVKWKVKLGAEARPETVATRLVWAVGYFTDEDYFVEHAEITQVPFGNLHRLKGLISSDSTIRNARFERQHKGEKKEATWSWKTNEFTESRQLNGLRTMMALINNWDLKDENNSVYKLKDNEELFVVTDLGASFGPLNPVVGHEASRGNLNAYRNSRFITHKSANRVDFACPGRPQFIWIFNPHEYFMRTKLERIARNVPTSDAKWVGGLLARLSPAQVRDAFRAAGYTPEQVEGFAKVVESRIAALNAL